MFSVCRWKGGGGRREMRSRLKRVLKYLSIQICVVGYLYCQTPSHIPHPTLSSATPARSCRPCQSLNPLTAPHPPTFRPHGDVIGQYHFPDTLPLCHSLMLVVVVVMLGARYEHSAASTSHFTIHNCIDYSIASLQRCDAATLQRSQ